MELYLDNIPDFPGFDRGSMRISREAETPESLCRLVVRILDISPEAMVADLGCGTGEFLRCASETEPKARYYGRELDSAILRYAEYRLQNAGQVKLEQGNMFELRNCRAFDRVFSNYPFGLPIALLSEDRSPQGIRNFLSTFSDAVSGWTKMTSADWLFNDLLISCLKEDGKACAVMTRGSIRNTKDAPVRAEFIERGWIEAVILLPEKLFATTAIPTTLIVLSRGNRSVRMVDATEFFEKGRRQNALSDGNIDEIVHTLTANSVCSVSVSAEELRENEYSLDPARFLFRNRAPTRGKRFQELIGDITRGAPLRAEELDRMVSDTPTSYRYLMLADIRDGIIDEDLRYIREDCFDRRLEKYCIRKGDLILSKNGAPFKAAVAENEDDCFIIATGNLYIIRLTEDTDPYYIKAYLESESGTESLKRIAVGALIPNISVGALQSLVIPELGKEPEQRVSLKMRKHIEEVRVLRKELERSLSDMRSSFPEL